MVLASQIVHVTSEAKASPTMTACTTMSAFTNMFQGDRLRGSSATSVAARAAPGQGGHAGRATPTDHNFQHCSLHDRLPG